MRWTLLTLIVLTSAALGGCLQEDGQTDSTEGAESATADPKRAVASFTLSDCDVYRFFPEVDHDAVSTHLPEEYTPSPASPILHDTGLAHAYSCAAITSDDVAIEGPVAWAFFSVFVEDGPDMSSADFASNQYAFDVITNHEAWAGILTDMGINVRLGDVMLDTGPGAVTFAAVDDEFSMVGMFVGAPGIAEQDNAIGIGLEYRLHRHDGNATWLNIQDETRSVLAGIPVYSAGPVTITGGVSGEVVAQSTSATNGMYWDVPEMKLRAAGPEPDVPDEQA